MNTPRATTFLATLGICARWATNTRFAVAQQSPPSPPDIPDYQCILGADFSLVSEGNHAILAASDGDTSISDGGDDMYDTGNKMRLKEGGTWTSDLPYTESIHAEPLPGSATVSYFTHKRSGPTVFIAKFVSSGETIQGLRIQGDLGLDGSGTVELLELASAMGWHGYATRTFGNNDPSINHLIMAPASATQTADTGAADEDHKVEWDEPVSAMIYLLWAGRTGSAQI